MKFYISEAWAGDSHAPVHDVGPDTKLYDTREEAEQEVERLAAADGPNWIPVQVWEAASPEATSEYLCACGDRARAEQTPFGWMISCFDDECQGECGTGTANNHPTLESAEKSWLEELGGKVQRPPT